MCLGKSFEPKNWQIAYELHGFRRVGFYGLLQIIFTLIGILIVFFVDYLLPLKFLYRILMGGSIIILFNIIPNGKPFIFNLYKIGREYIIFDADKREIYLLCTKFAGCIHRNKLICSYSQFRGIAIHYKTKQILFLCKRQESLLLKHVGEVLPNNHNMENILEELSLFWFTTINDENKCFFGITYIPFADGIIAEGNVRIDTDYDYYLKNKNKRVYVKENENDQLQGVYLHEKDDLKRFKSIEGGSINVESDDGGQIVDYV